MKKIVIEIEGGSGRSFDLALRNDSLAKIEGTWQSLPGYMPQSSGFYYLNDIRGSLQIWDRDIPFWEDIENALGLSNTEKKIYGVLENFISNISKLTKGTGSIFKHGKLAKDVLVVGDGYVSSKITWQLKSII